MTPAGENGAIYPVDTIDGEYFVRLPSGQRVLITDSGKAGELPPGWTPRFLYTAFEPLYFLELIHESGQDSTWFLDETMARIGFDDPGRLQPFEASLLRLKGQEILRDLWRQLLCMREPQFTPEVQGFLQLGASIRNRVCRFCEAGMNMTPREFDLELVHSRRGALSLGDGTRLPISRLQNILRQDMIANICSSIPTGTLRWASPVSDEFVETDKGVWLTYYVLAYRLVDASGGPVTYLLVSSHPAHVIGIYFPADHVLFYSQNPPRAFLFEQVEIAFLRHICDHGLAILEAWREPARGFSAVFTSPLISAQIWHDLSGIDRMVRDIPRQHIPEIIGVWGLPEVYGDTEELYPETKGRVNRTFKDLSAVDRLIRYAYEERRCMLRMTHTYVTTNLYTRIIDLNTRRADLDVQRNLLAQVRAQGCPLILLGIRVESRTAVDLPEFCARMVEFVIQEAGKAVIVIDAHNGAGDDGSAGVFASEFQHTAKEQPIDVERRVVAYLQEKFRGRPVAFINNIGAPMSHSIFWCHYSDFFVTFYGTGLAKYRWACNKSGLIITSQWTLRNQPHLHIYEAGYLENPSPLRFLPEQYVTDLPDAPVLVPEPGNPPARWNFRVSDDGVFAELREFLVRSGHGRR